MMVFAVPPSTFGRVTALREWEFPVVYFKEREGWGLKYM
jgi:hypothetical protein